MLILSAVLLPSERYSAHFTDYPCVYSESY